MERYFNERSRGNKEAYGLAGFETEGARRNKKATTKEDTAIEVSFYIVMITILIICTYGAL